MTSPSMPDRREFVLDCAGSSVHAWVAGPVSGPLVALTHGASMDHRMFDPQLGPLVDEGYQVLTWDIRGHGRSQPLGRVPLSVGDMVDDLLAVLDYIGAQGPICVGGQSLGGYVAQELLYRHPERVAAIVIVGSSCITLPIPWWQRWALRSSPWWFVPWPWASLIRTVARSTALRPEVRRYAEEAINAMSKRDFIDVWRGVAGSMRPEPGYRITAPLLLTHGNRDRTGNIAKAAPVWAARDSHSRYEVIPDASHNANQDNAEAFNWVLLEFLAQHYSVDRDRA